MRFLFFLLLGFVPFISGRGATNAPAAGTNAPPKAARSVQLIYEATQADVYYNEMVIEKTTDNSFFTPIGWENGYFGLQQYNGPDKRAVNFTVWNALDDNGKKSEELSEILYANPRWNLKPINKEAPGTQCMRQYQWKIGQTNRFAVAAIAKKGRTTYTAWFFDGYAGKWEKVATIRVANGKYLRTYHSFVEDFRRDFQSPREVRRATFANNWWHERNGAWLVVKRAMFTASNYQGESKENIDAGSLETAFYLSTGGDTQKSKAIGSSFGLNPLGPIRTPEAPQLPFLFHDLAELAASQKEKER